MGAPPVAEPPPIAPAPPSLGPVLLFVPEQPVLNPTAKAAARIPVVITTLFEL
jgi:hypothetical protein